MSAINGRLLIVDQHRWNILFIRKHVLQQDRTRGHNDWELPRRTAQKELAPANTFQKAILKPAIPSPT